jgi:hypothetical protein
LAWRTLLAVTVLATLGTLLALAAPGLAQGGGAPAGARQVGPGPVGPPGATPGTPGMPGREGGSPRPGAPMGRAAYGTGGERPPDGPGSAATTPVVIVAAVISVIAVIAALGLRKKG